MNLWVLGLEVVWVLEKEVWGMKGEAWVCACLRVVSTRLV